MATRRSPALIVEPAVDVQRVLERLVIAGLLRAIPGQKVDPQLLLAIMEFAVPWCEATLWWFAN